jgi:hypothetical protein
MTRAPDVRGRVGRAWRLSTPAHPACLAAYLVHRPGAHPCWSCYYIAVAHLRDESGLGPAKRQFAAATHEFQIHSLDPDHMAEPDPSVPVEQLRPLTPPDLVFQFTGTDEEAERLVADAAHVICIDASVSPDSDFRAWWLRALPTTLEHYRAGGHECGAKP